MGFPKRPALHIWELVQFLDKAAQEAFPFSDRYGTGEDAVPHQISRSRTAQDWKCCAAQRPSGGTKVVFNLSTEPNLLQPFAGEKAGRYPVSGCDHFGNLISFLFHFLNCGHMGTGLN